jgi:hypothetical protein
MLKVQINIQTGGCFCLGAKAGSDESTQHRCADTAVIVTKPAGESFGNLLSIQNLNQ